MAWELSYFVDAMKTWSLVHFEPKVEKMREKKARKKKMGKYRIIF